LTDKRRHTIPFDVRTFRGAECDIDHYLMVAKVRRRLSVSKRAAQELDMGRFNINTVDDTGVKRTVSG